MNGAEQMGLLRQAGFSDQEISEWAMGTRQTLSDAGFSQEEINSYFGKPPLDEAPIHGFFGDLYRKTFGEDFHLTGEGDNNPNTAPQLSFTDAIRAGFEVSVTGLLARRQLPEHQLREQAPLINRVASGMATMAGDFPFMLAGMAMGGAMGGATGTAVAGPPGAAAGGVIGAGGMMIALPAGLRRSLIDSYREGSIDSFGEYWERLSAVAADSWDGFVTGAATAGVGKLAPKPIRLPAEISTMVTVGSALQGEVPEPEEFLEAAIVVAGMRAAEVTVGRMQEVFVETGKRPRDIIEDSREDPTIREDILSDNHSVPRAYRNLMEPLANERGGAVNTKPEPAPEPAPKVDPDIAAVLGRVSVGEHQARPVTFDGLYQGAVDRLHHLNVALKAMAEGKPVDELDNFYLQARNFAAVNAKADVFLQFGTRDFNNPAKVTGAPLQEVLARAEGRLDELRAYAVASRALELEGRGIETGVPLAEAKATVQKLGADMEPVFRDLVDYQERVLTYLRDSGNISGEMFQAMREANRDFVPFHRVMEEAGATGPGKGLQAGNPVRRIKGSSREIVDPLETVIGNTYLYVNMAERNSILRSLVDFAAKSPRGEEFVQRVPTPTKPVKVTAKEAGDALGAYAKEAGVKLTADDFTIFRPDAQALPKNRIAVYRDGKRELYDLTPELAETVKALDRESVNMLIRALSLPAQTLRAGAILAPEFMVRNPARDQFSAFVFSDNGFIPFLDAARGVFSLIRKDKDYQDWLTSGGPQATLVSLDRRYLQKNLRDLTEQAGLMSRARNVVRHPIETLRILSELTENATRLGEFKRAVGSSPRDKAALLRAGYASREVILDFGRIGAKTQAVNALLAFWNARIQGNDKLIRAFRDRPAATLAKTFAAITLPSVLLQIVNRDEPGWEDIPQWQKDLFWLIRTDRNLSPEELDRQRAALQAEGFEGADLERELKRRNSIWWRIPKPFELGVLFGTAPERIVDYILDRDPKAFDGILGRVGSGFNPGFWPTFMVPIVEAWSNRSLFLDRPIIPRDREGTLPEYQFNTYTTETAKAIGKLVGQLPGVGDTRAASPAIIENFIRGWSGGLGLHILNIADKALTAAGLAPEPVAAASTLADIPVIKAFVVRHPSAGAEQVQRFYDRFEEYARNAETLDLLKREGDAKGLLRELARQHGVAGVDLSGIRDALSAVMKAIRLVNKNPDISPEEKRQLIDSMYFQMIGIAEMGNRLFDTLDEMREGTEG